MAEEPALVANGNGHLLSSRSTCEQNGVTSDEIFHTNGCHAPQTSMHSYKDLLTKPHIQQRLDAYKESKQSRIDKFLAHLQRKQHEYLETICPNVL